MVLEVEEQRALDEGVPSLAALGRSLGSRIREQQLLEDALPSPFDGGGSAGASAAARVRSLLVGS